MKVITGLFYLECNTFNPSTVVLDDFVIEEGEKTFDFIQVKDYFESEGFEVIPTIMASALSGSALKLDAYEYLKNKMLKTIKDTENLDAVWLHLHGSMEVEEIGSGEVQLLKEIRQIVGEDVVIGVVFDPHANHDINISKYANVIRGYRTIPHHDQKECELEIAQSIVSLLEKKQKVKPSMSIIPMIISGEMATDVQEPVVEIFDYLDKLEEDERILQASVFFGCAWADVPNGNFSVTVTPSMKKYEEYANEECVKISEFLVNERGTFSFITDILEPNKAVDWGIDHEESPVFITDSGDNTTGGAGGESTELLEVVLQKHKKTNKKIIVGPIYDPEVSTKLAATEVGKEVNLNIGTGRTKNEKPIDITAKYIKKGELYGYLNTETVVEGISYVLQKDNVDIVVSSKPTSLISPFHFKKAGVPIKNYDICIIKQGYLFSDLQPVAKDFVMAATQGATYQYLEKINFKNIARPMWPLDEIKTQDIKYNF